MENKPIINSFLIRKRIKSLLLTIKLLSVLIFAGSIAAFSSTYSKSAKLDLRFENSSLTEILSSIEKNSEFIFIYNENVVNSNLKRSISVKNESIEKVLSFLFQGIDVSYRIDDRQVFLYKKDEQKKPESTETKTLSEQQQKKEISGTVKDTKGLGIPGVTVMIKGTTTGIITDAEGKFRFQVPATAKSLQFSFVGMKTQEINVTSTNTINVVMEEETVGLGDVVVVGYGTQKKVTVTGAISTISTDKLLESPQVNISNSLAGRLPGLLAVQPSGEPGNDKSIIRIRGIGTFSGSAEPLIMVDGIETDNYNNIDANEIETVSILKDASATAVYGVRGANGVLLITTKRGVEGKPQVSFTSNVAVSHFPNLRKDMNSYDYTRYYNEALQYDSYLTGVYNPHFSASAIQKYKDHSDPIFYPDVNWTKLLIKDYTPQVEDNLNISGGSKNIKYFVSMGYLSQPGIFNNTNVSPQYDANIKYKRYNFRSNFDFTITKDFTANVSISSQIEDRISPGSWNTSTFMAQLLSVNPTFSPGIVDGKVMQLTGNVGYGPLAYLLSRGYSTTNSNYLNGSVRLNYKLDFITKGLAMHGTISYNNFNSDFKGYWKDLKIYQPKRLPDNSIVYLPFGQDAPFWFSETNGKNRKSYAEFGFDYSRSFGNHNIGGLVLYDQSKRFDPRLAFQVPNGYQGVVGRVTYDFKHRYLAEFNMGYNGTENFAPNKRFGFFPAVSAGWVPTEEAFFPKNDIVSFLKLKGSYGEVGNDKIGIDATLPERFLYLPSSYGYGGNYFFGQAGSSYNYYGGSYEGKIGNPDLTWERAKKLDVGFELNMIKNKIKISADYFDENRNNILASQGTIPAFVAANLPVYNLGKMRNSGYDGSITYNDKAGQVNYWAMFNFTYAHNVVQFKDEVQLPYAYQKQTGQRFGQYFGLVAEGLYNTWAEVNSPNRPVVDWQNNRLQPGDIRYKDVNGDGHINSNDYVPIGYSNFPEKMYGLSFGADYKGFSFSVLFQAATNVSVSNSKKSVRGFNQEYGTVNYLGTESWTQERYDAGAPINFPHLTVDQISNNYQGSTFWIRDGSYLRLKSAEVGYTFKGGILSRWGINSARLYLNGSNLFTWDKMYPGVDPEIPNDEEIGVDMAAYPATQTFNLGLNVKF